MAHVFLQHFASHLDLLTPDKDMFKETAANLASSSEYSRWLDTNGEKRIISIKAKGLLWY